MVAKLRRLDRAAPALPREDEESAAGLDLGILNDHLGYFVRRLQLDIFQQFIAALAPLNVRPAQFSVLVVIDRNPGRPQAAIARALNIERAALAKMLHDLADRGWVERRTSRDDGRSHAVFLTGTGEKVLARMTALAEANERRLERRLGAGRYRELATLLKDFG
jgi:DNA-binding MarR family transcriptional regulator